MIRARSGISYSVHPSIHQNAQDVLTTSGDMHMTECARTETLSRGYLFRILEGEHNYELFHAIWLMDQVYLTASESFMYFPILIYLQADGTATRGPAYRNQRMPSAAVVIDTISLECIGSLRKWTLSPRQSQDPDGGDQGAGDSKQGDKSLEDRLELLKWVLQPSGPVWGAFSRCCAPRFGCDNEKVIQNVWKQFKELMDALLRDGTFRPRLEAMLTPDFCIATQLVQLKFRYEKVLRDIDAIEPLYQVQPTQHFIQQANKLCEHAGQIASLYDRQIVQEPGYVWYLAGLLLHIIREIVDRDYNKYSDSQESAQNKDDPDSNLYVRLVCDPLGEGGLACVLNTLESIHLDILSSHRDTLTRIGLGLRSIQDNPAKEPFPPRIRRLVERCSPGR
ncbi:hypothetical protein SLS58_008868 [Diplodia intermedia]|uniref:Uncharacterized protein n=1 Tax=Diplodia intermedia TaxID=856260 RepID=A0ABR3TG54_9PEZI